MISIIIIVKKDRRIEQVLAKLQDMQSSKPYEVVVVDASEGALDDIKKKYSFARWFSYENKNKSRTYSEQRNIGIEYAKGEIIAFIDADCIPQEDWLEKLVVPIFSEKEQFISGAIKPIDKNNAHIEESYPKYRDECETMNMAVTRKVIEDVGVFDESMEGCEDSDFCIRAREKGYKIRFEKNAVVYHDWGGFIQNIKRSFNGGKDRASLYHKHPGLLFSLTINNIYTFYYIAFLLFLPLALIFPPYILILFIPSIIKRRNPVKELYNLSFSAGLILKTFGGTTKPSRVLYIFNNVFPDNAGFGKRCNKELSIISRQHEVVVLCKKGAGQPTEEVMQMGGQQIRIIRFSTFLSTSQHIEEYEKKKGFYELYRNLDLLIGLSIRLMQQCLMAGSRKLKMYVVVSPLTVPFICYCIGAVFGARAQVVEFHDLEPELAQDIKHLPHTSIIMRIEYFLEKFVCHRFKNVVVTTHAQAERIAKRIGIDINRISVIPNALQVESTLPQPQNQSDKKILNIGYVSSFTFDYSIKLFKELLELASTRHDAKNIHFTVVGDGPILPDVKKWSEKLGISHQITYTGNIPQVQNLVSQFDVALVPWPRTEMTVTMAPTKLFEYMSMGKVIVAPHFGEFKKILKHGTNALLYQDTGELLKQVLEVQKNNALRKQLSEAAMHLFEAKFRPEFYEQQLLDLLS